jgi:hypothetical protein
MGALPRVNQQPNLEGGDRRRLCNGGSNKALMLAQATGRSPYNYGGGEGEMELVDARTMETTGRPMSASREDATEISY